MRILLIYGLGGLGMASIVVWLFFAVYDSPESERLHAQNTELREQIETNRGLVGYFRAKVDSLREYERNIYRTALDAEPIEETDPAAGGRTTSNELTRGNMDEIEARLDAMDNQVNRNTYQSAVILEMANMRQDELRNMPAIRPVQGNIISGYGIRKHPVHKDDRMHPGIDFMADPGTEVRATGNGIVRNTGNGANGLGNFVEIDHQNGYVSRYAHLQAVKVYRGQRVQRGAVIALSGNSGLCKGPHLFYQILKNNEPVDPIDYFYNDLSPEEFLRFKQAASQYNESMN
jgi:murein DD-endopeptidase MepM/ murein hydrolase activator NlpD